MVAVARVMIFRDESGPSICFRARHVSEGPFSHSITLLLCKLLRPLLEAALPTYLRAHVTHEGLLKVKEQTSSKQ